MRKWYSIYIRFSVGDPAVVPVLLKPSQEISLSVLEAVDVSNCRVPLGSRLIRMWAWQS